MASVSKFIGIGRITKDLELKDIGSCKLVNFSMAFNSTHKDGDKVTYLNFVAFNKVAEILSNNISKGSELWVEAMPQNKEYMKDGVKITTVNFIVSEFKFIGGRKEQNDNQMENYIEMTHHG